MLMNLSFYKKGLLKIFSDFVLFTKEYNLPCEIVLTENHPYLSKYTLKNPNLIVFSIGNFEEVTAHDSRSGVFYRNVNEFCLNFEVFFFSFKLLGTNDKPSDSVLDLYGLFTDYLHDASRSFIIIVDIDENYELKTKYFIHTVSNMLNSGLLKINSNYSDVCYSVNQAFMASIQSCELLKEKVKGGINAKKNV